MHRRFAEVLRNTSEKSDSFLSSSKSMVNGLSFNESHFAIIMVQKRICKQLLFEMLFHLHFQMKKQIQKHEIEETIFLLFYACLNKPSSVCLMSLSTRKLSMECRISFAYLQNLIN